MRCPIALPCATPVLLETDRSRSRTNPSRSRPVAKKAVPYKKKRERPPWHNRNNTAAQAPITTTRASTQPREAAATAQLRNAQKHEPQKREQRGANIRHRASERREQPGEHRGKYICTRRPRRPARSPPATTPATANCRAARRPSAASRATSLSPSSSRSVWSAAVVDEHAVAAARHRLAPR